MPEASRKKTVVVVSSTARDLPDHRKEVLDACLRQGMFPVMMEHLPASDAEAISASLGMVDEADIYVGVFAHRYGYVPKEQNPRQISITEMEYGRAVERKIPRLIFVMDKAHPITIEDVEQGEGATKLGAFKERVQTENIVNFFKSPEDLRAHVIHSLSQHRQSDLATFHYVSDIPEPPEEFIAHPYTLLQTHRLVGRQQELNLLTDWVAKPASEIYRARILNVVAVGGMGKSALTWTWFKEIAPQEMKPLAGRMWWSFYESDATFENFVTPALAYVSRRPLEEVQQTPAPERETQLLAALDREPFLLVLDGLERILIAYARMDAARLEDSQVGDQRNLRKTADPRAGRFLKRLAQVRNSRILITTRLYPADLESEGGDPTPGSFCLDIKGLTDEDAVELWRALNVTGSRDLLLPVFDTFARHPLLIQALAGEVKRYRRAPGDFEEWRRANPRFDPTKFPLLQDAMAHVLEFALRGLDDREQQVLQIIAAFRMPARYDTLAALLIGEGKPCADERELDEVLTELEDRGLVGWDRRANRYDLHPLVRGVVWGGLGDDARRGVYTSLRTHFEAAPEIDNFLKVNSFEDLAPAIELYNSLIGLGLYNEAFTIFSTRLYGDALYRLSASRECAELLEMLFDKGHDYLPHLRGAARQAAALSVLGLAYDLRGLPGQAAPLYSRSTLVFERTGTAVNVCANKNNLASALRLAGALRESEAAARQALLLARRLGLRLLQTDSLSWLGLTLSTRGVSDDPITALSRALRISVVLSRRVSEGIARVFLAQHCLYFGDLAAARRYAEDAFELARHRSYRRFKVRAARRQGEAAAGLNDFATAEERLHHALTYAHIVNFVEEELPALVALAELRRRQGDLGAARELLDEVWEAAERGPYRLFHADARNVLAQVERDAGNHTKAVEAATRAYELAWCDGPPFAYHWGLEKARALLKELGAGEPVLPPFDESKYEPMPEVEIDPADEFGAGSAGGDEGEG